MCTIKSDKIVCMVLRFRSSSVHPAAALRNAKVALDRAKAEAGLVFRPTAATADGLFPVDFVPRVLTGEDWGRLQEGAAQRARALDAFLNDVYSDRAIVRDYKSGSVRAEHQGSRWSSDRQLQVALYMLAVRKLLGLEPVAGLYQPLGGNDLRARGLFVAGEPVGTRLFSSDGRDEDELQAELQDAANRAIELAARLREGELAPCPQTCSRDGCRYPAICRVS